MRAGMVLEALAGHYQISLVVVPLYPSPGGPLPAQLRRACRRITILSPDGGGASLLNRVRRRLSIRRDPEADGFHVVHVFRLAALPFARRWLQRAATPRPCWHLDLDDVESVTHRRLADLYRLNGDEHMARVESEQAERYSALEAQVLREFDRVYVCSEGDRIVLADRGVAARICVLPNALPTPTPLPPRRADQPFTFLFVGTLGYYPNEDAVAYFCAEILPLLRRRVGRQFRVLIVGTGASARLARISHQPEVRLIGPVPDVAPWYIVADAVVAPLRAGGGTRIKVLEAFSYRRPVVSTSVGIEGIAAQPEEHVLVGDGAQAFAEQCARLIEQPRLRESLAERSYLLFRRVYTIDAVARTAATCSSPPPR
jgi:glycosyltransferase involved in cell wall biosynthesis